MKLENKVLSRPNEKSLSSLGIEIFRFRAFAIACEIIFHHYTNTLVSPRLRLSTLGAEDAK